MSAVAVGSNAINGTVVQRPGLLEVLRGAAARVGQPPATVASFEEWTRRFARHFQPRRPRELGRGEVVAFLEHIARTDPEPLSAVEMARRCLTFLYTEVLHDPVGELPWPRPPRLLDQVRQVLRVKHYSPRTEDCYVQWITP